MRQLITSLKNQRIKDVLTLSKGRKRKMAGVFGVEGDREITRALESGFVPEQLFICSEMISPNFSVTLDTAERQHSCLVFDVTKEVFRKLAVREDSGGAFAVMRDRDISLSQLQLPDRPLIIAAQGIEKPGNLGALLRSADGAGVDAVVVLDALIDIYNPNVIRSSLGTVFGKHICTATSQQFFEFCQKNSIRTFGAALTERTVSYEKEMYTGNSAIILGSEATGLTEFWLKNAAALIKIPMLGIADSLNVAMAGSILMYEARRQRS